MRRTHHAINRERGPRRLSRGRWRLDSHMQLFVHAINREHGPYAGPTMQLIESVVLAAWSLTAPRCKIPMQNEKVRLLGLEPRTQH